MSDGPLPGSRSERHDSRRTRRRRADAAAAAAAAAAARPMAPVIETLRPPPARMERRAEKRVGRRRRRRIIIALVVVVGLVAAGIAVAAYRRGHRSDAKAPPVKARTQRTLLLQVPAETGEAVGSLLLVTDPATGGASLIVVPSRMLSQVPGYGSALFGEALKLGGQQLSSDTLANQLGVIVDGTWLVTRAQLVALVDAVGGVDVTVDVDLPGGSDSSGVALRSGDQHLDGQAAAAFATYTVAGQPELGRLNRLQVVLSGFIDKLPKTVPEITALLPVGSAPPAPSASAVAQSLSEIAQAKIAQKLAYKVVPVTDVDDGSDLETTRVDAPQLAALVAADLAGSVPVNEYRPDNRVVVQNGVGTPAVSQTVTRRLNAVGFSVVKTENADNFDYKTTHVRIFDDGDRAVSEGEAVAAALGLSADTVEVDVSQEQSLTDVIVTIGADYVPGSPAGSTSPSVGP